MLISKNIKSREKLARTTQKHSTGSAAPMRLSAVLIVCGYSLMFKALWRTVGLILQSAEGLRQCAAGLSVLQYTTEDCALETTGFARSK